MHVRVHAGRDSGTMPLAAAAQAASKARQPLLDPSAPAPLSSPGPPRDSEVAALQQQLSDSRQLAGSEVEAARQVAASERGALLAEQREQRERAKAEHKRVRKQMEALEMKVGAGWWYRGGWRRWWAWPCPRAGCCRLAGPGQPWAGHPPAGSAARQTEAGPEAVVQQAGCNPKPAGRDACRRMAGRGCLWADGGAPCPLLPPSPSPPAAGGARGAAGVSRVAGSLRLHQHARAGAGGEGRAGAQGAAGPAAAAGAAGHQERAGRKGGWAGGWVGGGAGPVHQGNRQAGRSPFSPGPSCQRQRKHQRQAPAPAPSISPRTRHTGPGAGVRAGPAGLQPGRAARGL
jgi:hypothetical protein